jgi:DNA polymerase-3 subunit beta
MKNIVQIRAGAVAGALKSASAIVQSSAIVPILANVKLEADGTAMVITTNDMEVEYRQTVPVESGSIAITISARRFSDIASALPSDALMAIVEVDGRVEIKSGRSRWILNALPVSEYPAMPIVEKLCKPVKMSGAALALAIKRTVWAASTEISSQHLAGIFLNAESGKLRLVASGRNMAMVLDTAEAFPKGAPDVIMPATMARTIERAAGAYDGEVSIAWDDRKLQFIAGDVTVTGKLLDGTYHDYRRALTIACEPVTVENASVVEAIKRVRLASDDKTVLFKLTRAADSLLVSVKCAGVGEACEDLLANCPEGALFETGINANYMAGMCEAIGGETIEMFQESEASPIIFRRVVPDGSIGVIGAARAA